MLMHRRIAGVSMWKEQLEHMGRPSAIRRCLYRSFLNNMPKTMSNDTRQHMVRTSFSLTSLAAASGTINSQSRSTIASPTSSNVPSYLSHSYQSSPTKPKTHFSTIQTQANTKQPPTILFSHLMADKAGINRSLSTIRTELEYLRDSGVVSPPQFQSIMAQLPVRKEHLSSSP